jgi:hypothetical protein
LYKINIFKTKTMRNTILGALVFLAACGTSATSEETATMDTTAVTVDTAMVSADTTAVDTTVVDSVQN